MAIDKDAWGTRIRNAVNAVGIVAGVPITNGQLETIWRTIKNEDKTELTTKVDITLQAADVPVPAAGIIDSQAGACTGAAVSGPTAALNSRLT